jgi:PBP1b-binding outer membrane lipoprotein LpoB
VEAVNLKSVKIIVGSIAAVAVIAGCSATPSQVSQKTTAPAADQVSVTTSDPKSKAVTGGTSGSLAYSYDSIEELEAASVVIAEVKIKDVRSEDVEKDSTFYTATITDQLKGDGEQKEVVLTQVGVEEEREKTGELTIQRDNPLMKPGDSYVLFLKAGHDEEIGPLYYVAGEFQGKYEIQGDRVFSVNQEEKSKAMISGQDLATFKEEIKRIVDENQQ